MDRDAANGDGDGGFGGTGTRAALSGGLGGGGGSAAARQARVARRALDHEDAHADIHGGGECDGGAGDARPRERRLTRDAHRGGVLVPLHERHVRHHLHGFQLRRRRGPLERQARKHRHLPRAAPEVPEVRHPVRAEHVDGAAHLQAEREVGEGPRDAVGGGDVGGVRGSGGGVEHDPEACVHVPKHVHPHVLHHQLHPRHWRVHEFAHGARDDHHRLRLVVVHHAPLLATQQRHRLGRARSGPHKPPRDHLRGVVALAPRGERNVGLDLRHYKGGVVRHLRLQSVLARHGIEVEERGEKRAGIGAALAPPRRQVHGAADGASVPRGAVAQVVAVHHDVHGRDLDGGPHAHAARHRGGEGERREHRARLLAEIRHLGEDPGQMERVKAQRDVRLKLLPLARRTREREVGPPPHVHITHAGVRDDLLHRREPRPRRGVGVGSPPTQGGEPALVPLHTPRRRGVLGGSQRRRGEERLRERDVQVNEQRHARELQRARRAFDELHRHGEGRVAKVEPLQALDVAHDGRGAGERAVERHAAVDVVRDGGVQKGGVRDGDAGDDREIGDGAEDAVEDGPVVLWAPHRGAHREHGDSVRRQAPAPRGHHCNLPRQAALVLGVVTVPVVELAAQRNSERR
mmetsp:Transcript_6356/g.16169  ORF Transcript_6356/g.16169 Transcript_6356/m.16169 type:complete len:633 (+) Transcript_6356:794-2692(+)